MKREKGSWWGRGLKWRGGSGGSWLPASCSGGVVSTCWPERETDWPSEAWDQAVPSPASLRCWHLPALLFRWGIEMHYESWASLRTCLVNHAKAHPLCSISFREIPVRHLIILEKQFKSWLQSWENAKEGLTSTHWAKFQSPVPLPLSPSTPAQRQVSLPPASTQRTPQVSWTALRILLFLNRFRFLFNLEEVQL